MNTADTDLKDFCADHDKARWVFNFCVAGTQPPPIKGGTAEAPTQKLQTILALGNASEADFVVLEKLFTLMKALNNAKINRRAAETSVQELTVACEAAEHSHSQCKQRLAITIYDAEGYLE